MAKSKDELLQEVMAADFAVYELQLYLDTHPNSSVALALLAEKELEASRLRDEYESLYGPLTANRTRPIRPFNWIFTPWPWEKNGSGGNRPPRPEPPRPPMPPRPPRPEPPRPPMPPRPPRPEPRDNQNAGMRNEVED